MLLIAVAASLALSAPFWRWHGKPPVGARTASQWAALLRAEDPSARADATHDLARIAAMPALPCDVMVARLTDAAAVRVQAVALLTRVTSSGRCVREVLDVLASSAPLHSRIAAAQIIGAALDDAGPGAASADDRALAQLAGTHMLLDPDPQIGAAAMHMLDRIAQRRSF